MISKITQEILDIIKKDKHRPFPADQITDNTIILKLPGEKDQYKITITKVKNPVN